MTIELWTYAILAALIGLLGLGLPVGFATGAIAVTVTVAAFGVKALPLVASRTFSLVTEYLLIAVPMFVLMAAILDRSGIARDLFRVMRVLAGGLRGGLRCRPCWPP